MNKSEKKMWETYMNNSKKGIKTPGYYFKFKDVTFYWLTTFQK